MDTDAQRILSLGHNAWRTARADSAGVIVDAADYYLAFYEAAKQAKRTILLSGWQFDSGVPIVRGDDAAPGAEVRLLKFLNQLCEQKPDLEIHILAWDFHVVFALEREWMQTLYFQWATHKNLHFRFDDARPAGGAHHQKFAVIDREVSFLGGIDLCEARWDDRRHLDHNPLRLSHDEPVKPYHDVQAYFTGCDVADVLRELFIDRWSRSGAEAFELAHCEGPTGAEYLPRGAVPLGGGEVAFSRTDPRGPDESIREVEALFIDAIAAAERLIYIETQYFSSRSIGDALVTRMRAAERPRLDIVVVLNTKPEALKEEVAIGLRQAKTLLRVTAAAKENGHALGIYDTLSAGTAPDRASTYIHSKLLAVDDRFLTVGSANLTNRSMGVDTELHATWETTQPSSDGGRLTAGIASLRISLLAEHTGLLGEGGAEVGATSELAAADGLVARLDRLTTLENARLRRHILASAREMQVMKLVDADALPFDPADPEYDDVDGSQEETANAHGGFAEGIAALRDKIKSR